jgi:hypothetical protein
MALVQHGIEFRESSQPHATVTLLCSDHQGTWLRVGGAKEWVDLRITPSGLLRVGKAEKVSK